MGENECIGESMQAVPSTGGIAPGGEGAGQEELPVFDRAAMMTRLMDDEELARIVLSAFLEDQPRQIAQLKERLEKGDAPNCGRLAHSIKGAAANVGGERLREMALGMEKEADLGNLAAVASSIAALEEEFSALRETILSTMLLS
jgi:HPt (histidine-containing phosphotransfer) domain-containing protein